jgi:hypothetical protein
VSRLRDQLAGAKSAAARARANASGKSGDLMAYGAIAAGGAAAGAAVAATGKAEVFGVNTKAAVGALGVAVATFALPKGKASTYIGFAAAGALAAGLSDMAEDMLADTGGE